MELIDYESLFDDAKVDVTKFQGLPDGKYTCKVNTVRIEFTKKDKYPMIAWDFIVADGEQAGKHIFHNRMFSNKEQAEWAKEEMWKLGIEVETLADLKKYFNVLINAIVEVTLKSKMKDGEMRQSSFLNKLVSYAEV